MIVKDILNDKNTVCTESMPLEQVYELMQETLSEFVVVVESNAHRIPIGTITEHDICMQIVGRGRTPRGLCAANVMNSKVTKIKNDSIVEDILLSNFVDDISTFVVIDDRGSYCGTVSGSQLHSAAVKTQPPMNLALPANQMLPKAAFDRIF
jgi:predicted transcriptional regulator